MEVSEILTMMEEASEQSGEHEQAQKKMRLVGSPLTLSISDVDLRLPANPMWGRMAKIFKWLPALGEMFFLNDLSRLQKFLASRGSISDIKLALNSELVALCVWFLYTGVHSSPKPKDVAFWVLKTICNASSEGTFDDNHQLDVDSFVETLLHSKNVEVLRQACCTLALLAFCRREGDDFAENVTFGGGVQKRLLALVTVKHDSFDALPHALLACSYIVSADEDMREGIITAEINEPFLLGLLKRNDTLKYALRIIAYTNRDMHRMGLIEKGLFEGMIDLLQQNCVNYHVRAAAAGVISDALDLISPTQIEQLVDMGCLEALCTALECGDSRFLYIALCVIGFILDAGEKQNIENMYAKRIAKNVGWSRFEEVYEDYLLAVEAGRIRANFDVECNDSNSCYSHLKVGSLGC